MRKASYVLNDSPSPKRLVLCRGQFCNMDRRADKLYRLIEPIVYELNDGAYPPRFQLTTANCLDMCGAAPNCIIQPGGKPFNHLTPETLFDIVDTYLVNDDA